MNFLKAFFFTPLPHNYPAELKAINVKIEKKPGNMADYDRRSEIHFQLGNTQAAIMDFAMATSLELDSDMRELRDRELTDMRYRYS